MAGPPIIKDPSYSTISRLGKTSTKSASAPPAPAPPPPAPVMSGGGGGGGGGGGMPAVPAAPPPPMRDTDWFNSDAEFRQGATGLGTDLYDQLAELLYQRTQGFQGIDDTRRDWGQSRDLATTGVGEQYAANGLLSSGLYKQALDMMLADYEKQNAQIGNQEQSLVQQLGQRDSLTGGLDRNALFDSNYTGLADIYGLLGSRGVQAGNQYNQQLQGLRAQSAGRATEGVVNTLGW